MNAQVGGRGKLYPINIGARCGVWSSPRSGRFNPGNENLYPFYRRMGGHRGQSRLV